jgi:hypothetical protein
LDKDENWVGGIEDGFWPTDSLKAALDCIEKHLGNKQITRNLRKIINM